MDQALKVYASVLDALLQRRSLSQREKTLASVCYLAVAAGAYAAFKRRKSLKSLKSLIWSKSPPCIYLDYNGSTPIYPQVLESMMPYLTEHYGNPSSSHIMGKEPRRAINQARESLLKLLGAPTSQLNSLWFTSSGTESDNLAIELALQSTPDIEDKHIVTCNVEHQAVELYLKKLEGQGKIKVTAVPVDQEGRVSAKDMIAAIRPNTILVTLMLANNESGALQPVQEVARECRKRGILMHTDAAQAAGKVSVRLEDLGYPDMIAVVGHKLGAMKGIAALYVREGCFQEQGRKLQNQGVMLIGGGQEFGRRAGTENTPSIVGFGTAAEMALSGLPQNARHMESLRSRLLSNLQAHLGDANVRANGPSDPSLRLPNTLSVGFKNIHSGDLLAEIGHQVGASAGATCHSAGGCWSAVLKAMKVPEEFGRGTLRLSLGPRSTAADIDRAAIIIAEGVKKQLDSRDTSVSQ
jgi:cysteine desulfurase